MNKESFEQVQHLLLAQGYTIGECSYDAHAFGSWHLVVLTEPHFRIVYDARDGLLSIQRESSRRFAGLPVWDDIWTEPERGRQSANTVVSQLLRIGVGT